MTLFVQNNQFLTHLDDHKTLMASPSSSSPNKTITLDKTNQQPDPLKCPRCDSSNTKFCYYNNYSLSQPRHFCKACKRYWTRGGTLRNVPVGGGCRKNKRVKRSNSNSTSANAAAANPSSVQQPQIDRQSPVPPALNNNINNHGQNLFYGVQNTNPLELNFPFSNFRVSSSDHHNGGFDQMSGAGLGFSFMGSEVVQNNEYIHGFKQIRDSLISGGVGGGGGNNNSNFFGSSSSSMTSLLASGFQHQRFVANADLKDNNTNEAGNNNNNYPGVMAYNDEDAQNGVLLGKEVKMEGPKWNMNINSSSIHDQQMNPSDPSSLLWNTSNVGGWFDPSNMGSSSVPSLI